MKSLLEAPLLPCPRSPSAPCLRSGRNCDEEVTITSLEVRTGADGTKDPVTAMVTHIIVIIIYTLIRRPLGNFDKLAPEQIVSS